MNFRQGVSLLLLGVALAGCSDGKSEDEAHQVVVAPKPAPGLPAAWEQRSDWLAASRGGAAIRHEGYQFVLAHDAEPPAAAIQTDATPEDPNQVADRALSAMKAIDSAAAPAPPSTREPKDDKSAGQEVASPPATAGGVALDGGALIAWERYCSGRAGMTADDWTVIMNTSGAPYLELEKRRRDHCAALRHDYLSDGAASTR